MTKIGIIGTGVAGLHLGLYLQQQGVAVTLYGDRTPEEIRASRLPNTVARFERTRARERLLGVNHWDCPEFEPREFRVRAVGPAPLAITGRLKWPISFMDMRLYEAILLEDYVKRGGEFELGAVQVADLPRLARQHELLVVAAGRSALARIFPRRPEGSPFHRPQRLLFAGLFHGIPPTQPAFMSLNISPMAGEIFQAPFYTAEGWVSNLLFEGLPGGPFEPLLRIRYEDDPGHFEATVLDLVREHAPAVYERIDPAAFRLTGPKDYLQNGIVPTARLAYAPLEDGRYVMAIGDAFVLNDPINGQGANLASECAWMLGQAILEDRALDASFCQELDARMWNHARKVFEWSNQSMLPPPPHVQELLFAASQVPAIADDLFGSFQAPARAWEIHCSPEGARAFLRQHGWQGPAPLLAEAVSQPA